MNPEQMQIAVLEKMGWKKFETINGKGLCGWTQTRPQNYLWKRDDGYLTSVPDFIHSETAIFAHLVPWMRNQECEFRLELPLEIADYKATFIDFKKQQLFQVTNKSSSLAILECAVKALGLWKE